MTYAKLASDQNFDRMPFSAYCGYLPEILELATGVEPATC